MANATAANATQEEMTKQLNDYLTCNGTVETINCTADRCSAIRIAMSITPPGLNKSLDLIMAMKNCSSSAMCILAAEERICGAMEAMLNATEFMKPTKCQLDCCEGDLCDFADFDPTSAGFQPGVAAGTLFAGLLASLLSRAP